MGNPLAQYESFRSEYLPQWEKLLLRIFSAEIPADCEWTVVEDVVAVLQILGSIPNTNHIFFPTGGGLDINNAMLSKSEPGFIDLDANGLIYRLRPRRLLFHSFGAEAEWAYFWLETAVVEPQGDYEDAGTFVIQRGSEELTEITPNNYVASSAWEKGEYNGSPLPIGARPITRLLHGTLVIFAKPSVYNLTVRTAYDALHNSLTDEQFKRTVSGLIAKWQEIKSIKD